MFKLFHYIFTHFSGFRWGWFSKDFAELGGANYQADGWKMVFILFTIYMSVTLISNIVTFLIADEKERLPSESNKYYIPLAFLYLIYNVIFHLVILCLFFTIGGLLGFCIGGFIWLIYILATAISSAGEDGYTYGFLNNIAFIAQYSKKLGDREHKRSQLLERYNKFLNIEY
jgi:hypothetical protein